MDADVKISQLKTWLDQYLNVARAFLNKPPTYDLVLYFVTAPPEVIKIHCSTANYKTLPILNGEFLYNGPKEVSNGLVPQLYFMKNGSLVPVLKYSDYFSATLISINPEYQVGKPATIKAQEVVVYDYVNKNGDDLLGPLRMPANWIPSNPTELVPKIYVDTLRAELEARIGTLETKVL